LAHIRKLKAIKTRTFQADKHISRYIQNRAEPPTNSFDDDMHLIAWKRDGLELVVFLSRLPSLLANAIVLKTGKKRFTYR
jgi:hypothetical protein